MWSGFLEHSLISLVSYFKRQLDRLILHVLPLSHVLERNKKIDRNRSRPQRFRAAMMLMALPH